jgi:dUTP pyrophosphatase
MTSSTIVALRRLRADAVLPAYATPGAAGVDLSACIDAPVTVAPGQRVQVPTGLAIALPTGFVADVRPRSGLAWRAGLTVLNAPGTIDCDYRGELLVVLLNTGDAAYTIQPGDRVAQLVVLRYERVTWHEVAVLDDTERGAGGYGSTGR